MEKNSQDIPRWLCWPEEVDPPETSLLNESRKELYEALSLFHSHVKYVIYIMITMPAVILAIIRLWPAAQPNMISYVIAAIILVFVLPIGVVSILVIHKYYQVYVSALVFATRVHIAAGYKQLHPWLERTLKQAQDWKVDSSLKFIERRTKSFRDTFMLYSLIIGILAGVSCVSGIIVLYFGFGV